MKDREKLIDLLNVDMSGCNGDYAEEMADYLITNGVTFAKDINVPSKGHWIIRSSGRGSQTTNWAECSECHVCGSPQWKVCPVCETKME